MGKPMVALIALLVAINTSQVLCASIGATSDENEGVTLILSDDNNNTITTAILGGTLGRLASQMNIKKIEFGTPLVFGDSKGEDSTEPGVTEDDNVSTGKSEDNALETNESTITTPGEKKSEALTAPDGEVKDGKAGNEIDDEEEGDQPINEQGNDEAEEKNIGNDGTADEGIKGEDVADGDETNGEDGANDETNGEDGANDDETNGEDGANDDETNGEDGANDDETNGEDGANDDETNGEDGADGDETNGEDGADGDETNGEDGANDETNGEDGADGDETNGEDGADGDETNGEDGADGDETNGEDGANDDETNGEDGANDDETNGEDGADGDETNGEDGANDDETNGEDGANDDETNGEEVVDENESNEQSEEPEESQETNLSENELEFILKWLTDSRGKKQPWAEEESIPYGSRGSFPWWLKNQQSHVVHVVHHTPPPMALVHPSNFLAHPPQTRYMGVPQTQYIAVPVSQSLYGIQHTPLLSSHNLLRQHTPLHRGAPNGILLAQHRNALLTDDPFALDHALLSQGHGASAKKSLLTLKREALLSQKYSPSLPPSTEEILASKKYSSDPTMALCATHRNKIYA